MEGLTLRRIGAAAAAMLGVLAVGTVGFRAILDETWLQAFYRAVVTSSLTGLDTVPRNDAARLLSIFMVLAGVYANYAAVSFSDYEFTITFARIEHEVDEGEVPGAIVARVNMSAKFTRELITTLEDSWSKWSTREGIKNLPEAPSPGGDS